MVKELVTTLPFFQLGVAMLGTGQSNNNAKWW
jgi:hypothetical protein